MIKIVYDGDNQRLEEAVDNANLILGSDNLRLIIQERRENFFNTSRTCEEIGQTIYDCSATIKIAMFTRGRNTNGSITTGYADPNIADVIHYNSNVLGNSVKAHTNTLVHEAVHIVDMFHDSISGSDFTHDGNDPDKPPGNRDSAPYWIGNRAQDLVDLLDDHVGHMKTVAAFDTVEFATVKKYLTQENWAAKAGFVCGTTE
jgi:hypothetical protein